ncbi:MAG: UbiA family prenyltransferase [Hydrogenophilales bacterium]
MKNKKIFIDLDHSLIKTDLFIEGIIQYVSKSPFNIFKFIFVLFFKGKSQAKHFVLSRVNISINNLPYNHDVIALLQSDYKDYEKIIISASPQFMIDKIVNHLDIIDIGYGSSENSNLIGYMKVPLMKNLSDELIYIGDSMKDKIIFENTVKSYIVYPSFFKKLFFKRFNNLSVIDKPDFFIKNFIKSIRLKQWIKNIMIFAPLFFVQSIDFELYLIGLKTFFAFSLVASSIYLINDLFDIEDDRKNLEKSKRPIPSGNFSFISILSTLIIFSTSSFFISNTINTTLFLYIFLYFITNLIYTLFAKKIAFIDIFFLSFFFNLRIFIGGISTQVPISNELFIFSCLFFYGLGGMKRIADFASNNYEKTLINYRGYTLKSAKILSIISQIISYISCFFFLFYVINELENNLYNNPNYLFFLAIILVFWIQFMWRKAKSGEITSDPIYYGIKNKTSLGFIVVGIIIFILSV